MFPIDTERLLVRRFAATDASDLYEYLSQPSIYLYESGEPISKEAAVKMSEERSRGTSFLAVELKAEHKLIGHVYIARIEPPERDTYEIGYIFNPRYQNRGYATESVKATLQHYFEEMGAHRIVAYCSPENVASWKVLEHCGMQREGMLRENIFFRRDEGGRPIWLNSYQYAILRGDL